MNGITKRTERIVVFAFGVVFVVVFLLLAIAFPEPTEFQDTVFRIILSVAVAGVAAFLPGFVEANVGRQVRAGGALAVFVMVYFFNPASLVSDVTDAPAPTDPFTIHIFAPGPETRADRFTFPYSDISRNASYTDFQSILLQLPGVKYSADSHTIFRIRDELILDSGSRETAVSRNNTGVLVIPESVLDSFDSDHEAFALLLGAVRDMD